MKKKTFYRVKSMVKPYLKTIIFVTILAIILDVVALAKPFLVKYVINEFMSKGIYSNGAISVFTIGLIYIGLVLFENILEYFNSKKTNMVGESVVFDLRNKLYKYMENANITFHDKVPSGKLFVRIISDCEDVYTLFSDVITTFVKDVLVLIGIIAVMFYLSWKLALISLAIIPLIVLASMIFTKLLNKVYTAVKNERTKVNTFFAESIYGVKLIKVFNRQKEKQDECEKLTTDYLKAAKPVGYLQGMLPAIMTLIENLGISLIIWATIFKITGQNIDIGLT